MKGMDSFSLPKLLQPTSFQCHGHDCPDPIAWAFTGVLHSETKQLLRHLSLPCSRMYQVTLKLNTNTSLFPTLKMRLSGEENASSIRISASFGDKR